ncbi:hypothetical protein AVEN_53025-1 [Araneus ventricosus]|uniref:DUF4461 domain-containing protein n=1 Tax=Araneus ventricosus TaxID=182803 RepID=A0A4Y2GU11_ARAVE
MPEQQIITIKASLNPPKMRMTFTSQTEDLGSVEKSESGPLMLSPTGQFIVPASCPALVLVDFIGKNMDEANQKLQLYTT